MDVKADSENGSGRVPDTSESEKVDFGFLPKSLVSQCQVLIESFHDLHGYSCLPDITRGLSANRGDYSVA
jgi:hypothetical protein